MLARYTMLRGKTPTVIGIRQDSRKHTRHCLRPNPDMVARLRAGDPTYSWEQFRNDYQQLITQRFGEDRRPFDALADLASRENVFLGCSCPTKKNPDVYHCHTVLALIFMKDTYPDLPVVLPELEE